MTKLVDIPVCILAGGSARRFGSPKGLANLNGERLIDVVINQLRDQTSGPIVINGETGGPYAELGLPIIADRLKEVGPLAGVHAAMIWADTSGFDHVATCTIDVPFLPMNTLAQLAEGAGPSICSSAGRWHPLTGYWLVGLAGKLEAFVGAGPRSAHAWAEHCLATVKEFPLDATGQDPFFNINTKEDLAKIAK